MCVLGSEEFIVGINGEPQGNKNKKEGQGQYVSGGDIEVIEIHGK